MSWPVRSITSSRTVVRDHGAGANHLFEGDLTVPTRVDEDAVVGEVAIVVIGVDDISQSLGAIQLDVATHRRSAVEGEAPPVPQGHVGKEPDLEFSLLGVHFNPGVELGKRDGH